MLRTNVIENVADEDVIVNKAIYEHDSKRRHGGRNYLIASIVASILLGIAMVIVIGLIQKSENDAFINGKYSNINKTLDFCKAINLHNYDALSTPIATLLIIILIILYQRRSFLRKKYSFSYIGLPMIVSCFNKTDRIYTGIVYGRIAFKVFNILYSTLNDGKSGIPGDPTSGIPGDQTSGIPGDPTSGIPGDPTSGIPGDPTGLSSLLDKVIEMFLIGIRYYPILVAYRVNAPIVYLLSAVYMWIDFGSTVVQTGICEGIRKQYRVEVKNAEFIQSYWIAYKVLMSIPTFFCSSFICISLTHRAITSIYGSYKRTINSKECCLNICSINDENEILYCQHDINYVLDIFRNREINKTQTPSDNKEKSKHFIFVNQSYQPTEVDQSKDNKKSKNISFKEKFETFFRNHIYNWNPSFKFSTRFISCHIVAIIALYFFFLFCLYEIIALILQHIDSIPDNPQKNSIDMNMGSMLCTDEDEDKCNKDTSFPGPLPESVMKFWPRLKRSLTSVFIVPMFLALLICVIQFLLSIRDANKHLIQLYKGECDYVPRREILSNPSIAASSFHFGGYLVGYLIWGFFLQYLFIFLISLIFLFLRMFTGVAVYKYLFFKLLPVVCGITVKQIVNIVASRFLFLDRKSKVLALENFRAYNVFLYFTFFFDCFMGFISAFIRIIKSAIANVFMMPRISYSFFGRHLERSDTAYGTYVGFLYMEATHTNPVLVSFCSLLCYKGLSEHIKEELRKNSEKNPPKYRGLVKEKALQRPVVKKQYKKSVVNKWHVMVMLTKNPSLVVYRKAKNVS